MSLEENKRIATEFLDATFKRDVQRVAATLSDGATYAVNGKHPRFRRIWTKSEWCRYLAFPTPFKDGLALTIRAVTAEDDRVSLAVDSYGVIAKTGKTYNNLYHWLFTLRDGKIVNIREYMDTGHVNDVLPLPPI